ncbi:MAG: carbohydrate kinase family protein [Xanthomonadales bacterium]|nr:carbohydrate kinase family protein [Xanthomonadales bacterium]
MSALICGSLAYDTIMVFPERFRDHILPDKIHMLNVSFLVPEMRREFGGVAGNISYNLKLLGGDPFPMATVGDDFGPYRQHFESLGISLKYVRHLEGEFTPQAFITTDLEDNQITAFHPGAMRHSARNRVADTDGIRIGIVAPDSKEAMQQHSRDFPAEGIPHIFDPGQAMILFDGEEMKSFIENATWIVTNDYECEILQQRTGWSLDRIAREVEALIVTRGAEGCMVYTGDDEKEIGPATADAVRDPTGCGDAFRAGLIHALLNDYDLVTGARLGCLMGAIKIASQGPQNHRPTFDEIEQRFFEAYGYRF